MAFLTIEDCAANRAPARLLRRADQDIRALIEGRLVDADLTFTQWIALHLIEDGVVSTAGALSRDLNITTGATTRMIDVLEERGLLLRDRSTHDRRVVGLKLTEEGVAAVAGVTPTVVGSWNEVIADFTREEVDLLVSLLGRLLTRAEQLLGKPRSSVDREAAE